MYQCRLFQSSRNAVFGQVSEISSMLVSWQVDVADVCLTALNLPTQRKEVESPKSKVLSCINTDKIFPENMFKSYPVGFNSLIFDV